MRERFLNAPDFTTYLDNVEENADLWRGVYDRVRIAPEFIRAVGAIEGKRYLLALSEDWCGDAVNTLPVVARLAEAVPNLELRVLSRDENLDLMDDHLTGGRSRSIPVVIVLDEDFNELGWWGPRPGPIQEWVLDEGLQMESADRYKEVRRYYAQDRGRTTLEELLDVLNGAGSPV